MSNDTALALFRHVGNHEVANRIEFGRSRGILDPIIVTADGVDYFHEACLPQRRRGA
jgi:hypothetical protein